MNFSLFPPPIKLSLVVPYSLEETCQRLQTRHVAKRHQGSMGLRVKFKIIKNDKYQVIITKTFWDSPLPYVNLPDPTINGYLYRQADATLVKISISYDLIMSYLVTSGIVLFCAVVLIVNQYYFLAILGLFAAYFFILLRKFALIEQGKLCAKTIKRRLLNEEFRMK